MVKRRLLALVLLCLVGLSWGPDARAADVLTPEETAKLATAKTTIDRLDKEKDSRVDSFSGLLELRDQLDVSRSSVRDVINVLNDKLKAAQAQLAELGAPPAAGAPPEPPQQAAEREEKQALVKEIDGQFRAVRAIQVQGDQLWDALNDLRRTLFNRRIFLLQDSFVSPDFWRRTISDSLPDFLWRARYKLLDIDRAIEARQGWPKLYGLAAFLLLLALGLLKFNHWIGRKQAVIARDQTGPAAKHVVVAHALLALVRFAAPFAISAIAIIASVTRIEIVPDEVRDFLIGVAGALLAYGIGASASRAVLSPGNGYYRILRTDDASAQRMVHLLDGMLIAYFSGLVVLGLTQMLMAHLLITVAATGLTAATVVAVGALTFFRNRSRDAEREVVGLVRAPLHLLKPIGAVLGIVVIVSLLLGYIALASFIVGRALASLIVLCLAVLVYLAIEYVFHDMLAPGQPGNTRIASILGINPQTVDLFATILSGTLRTLTVACTILIMLSPWGIEFGNINPFEDVFFGVRFGDVRGWIGAAGIAIILFTVGLAATRFFVGWLDGQLLPRTTLNDGVRHSITTIAGYLGFIIALTVALGQAGVQLQNIALVASALSVGIGFGLQQVVSNFVAGLIVLAERPIRVGDVIVVKGEEGKVRKISVRATELQLGEQSTVIVPNSDIVSSIVKNRSFHNPMHRTTVKFVLAHDMDLKRSFALMLAAADAHPNVEKTPEPKVSIVRVSEIGIELDLNIICERIGVMDTVRTDLYLEIMSAFAAAGIYLARGPHVDVRVERPAAEPVPPAAS
ncbi:MAG: DUF3772 domain-containing protein [Proteobacteria bacterium]|nr:DUF3772 domain-containing protein [Pseudomonadota bacterium]